MVLGNFKLFTKLNQIAKVRFLQEKVKNRGESIYKSIFGCIMYIMKISVQKSDDKMVILTISVAWQEIEKTRTNIENEMVKNVSAPGFRKGKVPENIAKEKIDKEKIKEELLRQVLPKYYAEALEKENIRPIITPEIHVEEFEEGTDMVFTARTCEEPEIVLNNYKEEVKKVTAKSKIILPGKEAEKPKLDDIVDVALKNVNMIIPRILVERETNRFLSQLIDELKTLGLTLDQYLTSKSKTGEDLRNEYEEKAEKDLKIEFMLRKIADVEKITVEQKDIDEVLNSLKDENQKKEIGKNPYFLASIIRQQKTLDFLSKI